MKKFFFLFISITTLALTVSAQEKKKCPTDSEVFVFHRTANWMKAGLLINTRQRLEAGAVESTLSEHTNGFKLTSKFEIVGQPGCHTVTVELFPSLNKSEVLYTETSKTTVVVGDIISAIAGIGRLLTCAKMSPGGPHSDVGDTLKNRAAHHALSACKAEGFTECRTMRSTCVTEAGLNTWEVILQGSL